MHCQRNLLGDAHALRSLSQFSRPEERDIPWMQLSSSTAIGSVHFEQCKAGCRSVLNCNTIKLGEQMEGLETCLRFARGKPGGNLSSLISYSIDCLGQITAQFAR